MKIFVNGSFDLIHSGHLNLLNYAKSLGDWLFVAIDTDRRISEKKGPERPFNDQLTRLEIMSNLKPVDSVACFDSDAELISIISKYKPDVMIVGSDWKGKPIIGSRYAKRVIYYDRVNDESTTKTIESYIDRRRMYR